MSEIQVFRGNGETVYSVPALLGASEGLGQKSSIVLSAVDGCAGLYYGEHRIKAEDGWQLVGWGDWDGPARRVTAEGCAWSALVPERFEDELRILRFGEQTS